MRATTTTRESRGAGATARTDRIWNETGLRAPLTRLRPVVIDLDAAVRLHAAAGRGLVDDQGGVVVPGRPIDEHVAAWLRQAGRERVPAFLPTDPTTPPDRAAVAMRAAIVHEVLTVQLGPAPEAYARDPAQGRLAAEALRLAVESLAWFGPAAELLVANAMHAEFLEPAASIATLATITGVGLGLEAEPLRDLAVVAFLADVGMLAVWPRMRQALDRLGRVERRELQRHTIIGAQLLDAVVALLCPIAPTVALQHHERIDGGGYPGGTTGSGILLEAQVVAVCSRYLALIRDTRHRQGLLPDEALDLVRGLSGQLAAHRVVDAFTSSVAVLSDQGVTTRG